MQSFTSTSKLTTYLNLTLFSQFSLNSKAYERRSNKLTSVFFFNINFPFKVCVHILHLVYTYVIIWKTCCLDMYGWMMWCDVMMMMLLVVKWQKMYLCLGFVELSFRLVDFILALEKGLNSFWLLHQISMKWYSMLFMYTVYNIITWM